jgi:pyrroline-5-carboxylate reductase
VRADVLVLAVKPQVIDSVLAGAAGAATAETLVLSIAAGTRMRRIAAGLNDHGRIVRAMPNTPASIGRGITGLCAGSAATAADRDTASALLAALGSVVWVEDERLLDPITAVSGSGPAFLFAFVEALEAAAQGVGLDAAQARQFARATVTGAAALLDATGSEAAELRRRVTSPNGTTQAGLDVLLSDRGLVPLLKRTVTAATRRAKELGESA